MKYGMMDEVMTRSWYRSFKYKSIGLKLDMADDHVTKTVIASYMENFVRPALYLLGKDKDDVNAIDMQAIQKAAKEADLPCALHVIPQLNGKMEMIPPEERPKKLAEFFKHLVDNGFPHWCMAVNGEPFKLLFDKDGKPYCDQETFNQLLDLGMCVDWNTSVVTRNTLYSLNATPLESLTDSQRDVLLEIYNGRYIPGFELKQQKLCIPDMDIKRFVTRNVTVADKIPMASVLKLILDCPQALAEQYGNPYEAMYDQIKDTADENSPILRDLRRYVETCGTLSKGSGERDVDANEIIRQFLNLKNADTAEDAMQFLRSKGVSEDLLHAGTKGEQI